MWITKGQGERDVLGEGSSLLRSPQPHGTTQESPRWKVTFCSQGTDFGLGKPGLNPGPGRASLGTSWSRL